MKKIFRGPDRRRFVRGTTSRPPGTGRRRSRRRNAAVPTLFTKSIAYPAGKSNGVKHRRRGYYNRYEIIPKETEKYGCIFSAYVIE